MPRLYGLLRACGVSLALGASVVSAQSVTVTAGDSLWTIARAHDTTVAALMAANGLDHDRLRIGQELQIAPADAPPVAALEHVVKAGDSLWTIARAYDTTVQALRHANGLDHDRLRIGQLLRVESVAAAAPAPVDPTPAAPAAEPAAVPAATPAPTAVFDPTVTVNHRVEPGDNLWRIARHYDTTVAALMALNALATDRLSLGQTLRVPSGVVATAAPAPAPATAPAPAPAPATATAPAPAPVAAAAPAASEASSSETSTAAPAAVDVSVSHTVRPGDSLYEIALAHGVSVDALIAWNDLDGTMIRPGQVLAVGPSLGAPTPAPLVVHVKPGDSLWVIARANGSTVEALTAANGISANATLRVGMALTVPGRFAAVHATSGAASPDVGGAATTVVRVAPGDSLWKIARQHNTTVAALMAVNAMASDRLTVGQAVRVVPGPDLGLAVAPQAAPLLPEADAAMVWPLVGPITSRFGWRRLYIGGTNMHYGLDIDGDVGDLIRSATAGTVTFSGWRGGFGKLVIVSHGDAEYYYAHASTLSAQVGDVVAPGQVVARVGATGNVTGPHLHFEIRVDGRAIDPLPILEARARR